MADEGRDGMVLPSCLQPIAHSRLGTEKKDARASMPFCTTLAARNNHFKF